MSVPALTLAQRGVGAAYQLAVVSGLTVSAVRRLKKSWAAVDKSIPTILAELESLMSRDNNFGSMRAALLAVRKATAAHGDGACSGTVP